MQGIHGEVYYISFTDGCLRHTAVYFLKSRKGSEILKKIKQYQKYIKIYTGKDLKFLGIDNGKKYINEEVKE